MSKRKPVEEYNRWHCIECDETLDHKPMMQHLREKHSIEPKTTQGKKSMLSHIDYDDSFAWNWEWEIGGLKLTQHTLTERDEEGKAYRM